MFQFGETCVFWGASPPKPPRGDGSGL